MSSQHQGKELRFFRRHELKVWNFSLILYVCIGAFLFHSLGEFEEPPRRQLQRNDNPKQEKLSIQELRLKSVRRMWNITNQLNILYESNWTLLVLDEIVEFEKSFLDALNEVNREEVDDNLEEKQQQEHQENDDNSENERRKRRRRTRSIQRSLIHSIATITTIGSPHQSEINSQVSHTQTGKLLTLIYGSLGIPMLIYTLSRSGKQLAHSSLNLFLILRHYFFSIPLHYLCCSCDLLLCFRWLSRYCCCCCCCYLFCCNNKNIKKTKCCDTQNAPKLTLYSRAQLKQLKKNRPKDGAATPTYLFSIPPNQIGALDEDKYTAQQYKSVRFENKGNQNIHSNKILHHQRTTNEDGSSKKLMNSDEKSIFSHGTFAISVTILIFYLAAGAYYYSQSQNKSLIDGLFICYEMISGSRLPDALRLDSRKSNLDPPSLYTLLKSNNQSANKMINSTETFAWNLIYMIFGLYLVSICGNFAHLWLSGEFSDRLAAECIVAACNGQAPIDNTNFNDIDERDMDNPGNSIKTMLGVGETIGLVNHASSDLHQYQQMPTISSAIAASSLNIAQIQQHPSQVDLAELFVVNQHNSPANVHQHIYSQQPQTSDVSLASTDRSADRASLCLHHQAHLPSTSEASIYNHHRHPHQQQQQEQQQLLAHTHLYLPTMSVSKQQQRRLENNEVGGEDDDEDEMMQMLKSCMHENGRSRSSSLQMSNGQNQSNMMNQNGFNQSNSSSRTASRMYPPEINSCNANNHELDSSMNTADSTTTNSYTLSSTGSNTIKLPQRVHHAHHNHAIGFILNQDTKSNNSTLKRQ